MQLTRALFTIAKAQIFAAPRLWRGREFDKILRIAVAHSSRTHNLQTYLWHVCGLLRRATTSGTAQRVTDTLYLTRVLVNYITEYLSAAQLNTLLRTEVKDSKTTMGNGELGSGTECIYMSTFYPKPSLNCRVYAQVTALPY